MNVAAFQAKWRTIPHTAKATTRSSFIDVCRLEGHPTPTEADPDERSFASEKGVEKDEGGKGFADVWYRCHFAWE